MSAFALTREERRLRRVSKDGIARLSWFETAQARLLAMRKTRRGRLVPFLKHVYRRARTLDREN
jgi:hypothetical protein